MGRVYKATFTVHAIAECIYELGLCVYEEGEPVYGAAKQVYVREATRLQIYFCRLQQRFHG
jgi:hypothetical protein